MQKASCLAEGILADCHSTRALLDAVSFREKKVVEKNKKKMFSSPTLGILEELNLSVTCKPNKMPHNLNPKFCSRYT